MGRSTMKKLLFTLLLMIVFVTTACGNEAVNEQEGEIPEQVVEDPGKEEQPSPESENEDTHNKEQKEEDVKNTIMNKSEEVIKLLQEKSGEELSKYVHAEKGLLFSPYVYIEDNAVTFDREKVKQFFEDKDIYTWGTADGSGEPIELTTNDYFSTFIYDRNFEQATNIEFDRKEPRGNSKRNIDVVFANSHTVEYYIKGTDANGNMDWKALNLVFQQDEQGEWMLVAIVHDQWTI
jgi:hypothetical protein